jgi:DNA-directed RNA polymerase specialized sigma24 family protein
MSTASAAELSALARVFEEHRAWLVACIRRRLDPLLAVQLDPEEVVQQTYLLAQRRWAAFRAQGTRQPSTWLYRLALDCLIDAWRRFHRAGRNRCVPLPASSV